LPLSIDMLGLLRRNSSICKDNLILEEKDAAAELAKYKLAGGRSFVDVTVDGLGRNPFALKRISAQTGINIICATGWYLHECHPSYVSEMSVDELSSIMVKELTEGIGDSGVRAGVIGELGTTEPLHPDEKKVLLAAAKAQGETGVPLTIHPAGYDMVPNRPDNVRHGCARKGEEYIDIIADEGILGKVYMSHMDGVEIDLDYHRRILDRGISIDYDLWGLDTAYYDDVYPGAWGVSDNQRADALLELCEQGYEKNIMLSHDVAMKIQLTKYGGFGYAHLLQNVVPVLKHKGVSESQIRTMMVENPKRIFMKHP
jgi:phosphotriesterase-related protein